jgi:HSP20 family protein
MAHEQQQTSSGTQNTQGQNGGGMETQGPTEANQAQGRSGANPTQGRAEANQQGMTRSERGTPERYRGLSSSSPFTMLRRLSDEMDRIFDDFFTRSFGDSPRAELERWPWSGNASARTFWPELELSHRDGKLIVQADLPGLKREDVKVELKENELCISGDRMSAQEHEDRGFYRSERTYGSFRRSIPLPQGAKPDTASATFENGVLRVEIEAPDENTQGRRIEVRESKTH